jgi:peptide-methionine (S)-S-oxide reductase
VGYAGGTTAEPTYYSIGDHSETVQVDFDPTQISYEELLAEFWDSHDPSIQSGSTQYQNMLLFHSEAQQEAANKSAAQIAASTGKRILTVIRPLESFYPAEDYHQKYYLRNVPALIRELQSIYPDADALRDSTAAARINGCLGGHCTRAELEAEIEEYGLTPAGMAQLRSLVRSR